MSMKFSVSFASRGAQRRHAEIIPTILSQNSTTSGSTPSASSSSVGGFLFQPAQWLATPPPSFRGDLDKEEQLQFIQLEREKRHGRWVNEQAHLSSPPVLDHMTYCAEALKMLITAARKRQLHQLKSSSPEKAESESEEDRHKSTVTDTNGVTIAANGSVTAPNSSSASPSAFDLKNIQNYRNLMEDVTIIVGAARQRTPEAGQKMIANIVEQLALLQLWA